MKKVKSIFLAAIISLFGIGFAQASNTIANGDSVIINFGKASSITIYLESEEDAEALKEADFNQILESVQVFIDSAKNAPNRTYRFKNEVGRYEIYHHEEDDEDKDESYTLSISSKNGLQIKKVETTEIKKKEKPSFKRTNYQMNLYLGLNNFLENKKIPQNKPYELRTLGSRFLELRAGYTTCLGRSIENSRFQVSYGISFSWYNFMFQDKNTIVDTENGVEFATLGFDNVKKTKLTASYLNLPILFRYKSKGGFKVGAGGFVGYRLGSHTKTKYIHEGNKQKNHERGSFDLTNFRYGLKAEIGIKDVTLFANYDINYLFDGNNNLPQLNAFSFGIRLF